MKKETIRGIRIFLLVLIILGLGLIVTQAYWVPNVVNGILSHEQGATVIAPATPAGTPAATPKKIPAAPAPAAMGGVDGTVTIGPTCPVMQDPPSDACADKPYATMLMITGKGGTVTVQSDAQGRFSQDLAPGTYTIQAASGAKLPRLSPMTFAVESNKRAAVRLSFDSGIR